MEVELHRLHDHLHGHFLRGYSLLLHSERAFLRSDRFLRLFVVLIAAIFTGACIFAHARADQGIEQRVADGMTVRFAAGRTQDPGHFAFSRAGCVFAPVGILQSRLNRSCTGYGTTRPVPNSHFARSLYSDDCEAACRRQPQQRCGFFRRRGRQANSCGNARRTKPGAGHRAG